MTEPDQTSPSLAGTIVSKPERIIGWRLVRAIAFGVGVGVAIAIAAGLAYWYVNRPKPWNGSSITARPIRAYVADNITFAVQYRLRNNTTRDLRVRLRGRNAVGMAEWHIFERGFQGLTPLPSGDTRLADTAADPAQLFLPPGEEVGLTVRTLILLSPEDSRQKIVDELRRLKFAGFVIYEPESRIRIDLPFSESIIEAK